MKDINKNFIYNLIYQIFIYIVPLITVPYISRILGADNIGIYSYSYSIVYYFMLFTLLGINNYGSRNIAKLSDNKTTMSKEFLSIYLLQAFNGLIMLIVYNIFVFFFIDVNKNIFLLQNIFLLSAILDINWFFFGVEKFKLTISRNIIIKIFSMILIFIFVKSSSDLWKYTFIMSSSMLLSQLYLWLFIKKNIIFQKVSIKDILIKIKPCLILFIPVVAYGIYRVMDKTMLGALSGTANLGYYENAEKIINIPISIVAALGTVMLPYMSKIKSNDTDSINKNIYSNFELTFLFTIPFLFGLLAISNDFSLVFFGNEFAPSGTIIKLLLPSVLFASIANVIRTNYLIPQRKDNIYIFSTIIGAVVNLVINMLLIPKFNYLGACIGTILAEFFVMFMQLIYVKNQIDLSSIFNLFIKYFLKGFIVFILIVIIGKIVDNQYLRLILQIVFAIVIYFVLNYKYIIHEFFNYKSM